MRTIIKYVGIALVIVGILLVMKNLFEKDTDWSTNEKEENNKNKYYTVEIKLLDKDQKNYLSGSKLTYSFNTPLQIDNLAICLVP